MILKYLLHWKDWYFPVEHDNVNKEFRIRTLEDARKRLDWCKKCGANTTGCYSEVVYEE